MYVDASSGLRFSRIVILGGRLDQTWRLGRLMLRHGVEVFVCRHPDDATTVFFAPTSATLVVIADESVWREKSILNWLRTAGPDVCVLSMTALLRRLGRRHSPRPTKSLLPKERLVARLFEAQAAGTCEFFVRDGHRQGRVLFAKSRVVWVKSNVPGFSFRENVALPLGLMDAQVQHLMHASHQSGTNALETLTDMKLASTSEIRRCLQQWFASSLGMMLEWDNSASVCGLRTWCDLSTFSFDLSELLIMASTSPEEGSANANQPVRHESGFRCATSAWQTSQERTRSCG